MNFTGIIPARYTSTHFPAKPLVIRDEKSTVQSEAFLKSRKEGYDRP